MISQRGIIVIGYLGAAREAGDSLPTEFHTFDEERLRVSI